MKGAFSFVFELTENNGRIEMKQRGIAYHKSPFA